jgi:environmental stress-induced protein Ves
MRVIRSSDYRRMPWKNGGGETAEIAVGPRGARLEEFEWRISMARVDGDGPFSAFAGVERTLAVLEGAGMRLRIAGREAVELTPDSPPYTFPADVATSAELLGGAITDFNVMTRRGCAVQRVQRQILPGSADAPTDRSVTLIFCTDGQLRASSATTVLSLRPRDSLLLEPDDAPVRLAPDPFAQILLVEIGAA